MARDPIIEFELDGVPPMWTIYERPLDAPDKFVVRVWHGTDAGPAVTVDTLDEARDYARRSGACINLNRMPGDEPQIVETWI